MRERPLGSRGGFALRDSEARLRAAADLVGLGWYQWEPGSQNGVLDARARALLGFSADAPVDIETIIDVVHPEDRHLLDETRSIGAHPTFITYELEYRLIAAGNGIERWIRGRGRAFCQEGSPKAFIEAMLDISEQKQAEKALNESRAGLQAAINLAALSPYTWDPATGALQWDARLKSMWGLPPDADVDHEIWLSAIHPQDRPRVKEALASCTDPAGDGVYNVDYRVIGIGDGIERWVSTHGQTAFQDGRPVGFIGAAMDITQFKQVDQELRESEARLAAILEQVPAGVALADCNGVITLGNKILRQYAVDLIPSKDPQQGKRWRARDSAGQLLSPDKYPGTRALRGETVTPGIDFIFTYPDGREAWTNISAAPFRNAAEEIVGAILVIQDIDREKRAEERFREFAAHTTDVLWISDTKTLVLEYMSPAFEVVFGLPRDAFLQEKRRWLELVHEDDRARVADAFSRTALGDVSLDEFRIVRADGAVRRIRNTFFPIHDAHGQIQRAGGIAQDITGSEGRFVYLVGAASHQGLVRVLREAGYDVRAFRSGRAFLQVALALTPGCVLLDLTAPEAGGDAVARELKAWGPGFPVIALGDAEGGVSFAVQVMKAGAMDFLPIPYDPDQLLRSVASATADIRRTEKESGETKRARALIKGMSPREREVLVGLLAGKTNKEIGREIGISPRTIEAHRARIMQRLGVVTLLEAVLLAVSAGLRPKSSG
ncbi:MAG: PAS domain-containing protein [Microvirga sp.]